jgi:hypothetical protein
VIKGHATKVNVIIGFFSGGENHFPVYYGFVLDFFSEKFV